MKHFKYSQLATLVIALCTTSAFAEQVVAKKTAEKSIEKITVIGSDYFSNPNEVSDDILERMRAATSDTASLFRNIPGINIQTSGGVSSFPVIRGLSDDRIRVKVDGMDLISACGNHMNPPLSYIDPNNVDNAAVYIGITPVSLGGDSIGSTIIVNSKDPEFSDNDQLLKKGLIGTSYRSNGNVFSGNVSTTFANKSFSFNYTGSTTKAENYIAGDDFKAAGLAAAGREWLAADEVGSSQYKSTNHALTLAFKHDNHVVDFKIGIQDIPYQAWVNQRMDMTANDSTQLNLHYKGEYLWGELDARIYKENTEHSMQFYKDKLFWYGSTPAEDGEPCTPSGGKTGCAAGMPMDTEGVNVGAIVKADITLANEEILRLGIETQEYTLDDWWDPSGKGMWPDTFININNGERDRLAFYGEWQNKIQDTLLVQLGIRYENVEMNAGEVAGYNPMMAGYGIESAAFNSADRNKTDDNIDITALIHYQFNAVDTFEIGYARKTRSPNLYERYTWSTGGMVMRMINMVGDGNGYVGNLTLTPEISHTVSAALDWKEANNKSWGITLSPYLTYIEDYIDVNRCASANMNCGAANQSATEGFVYLQFVNESARIYGVDLSAFAILADNGSYGDISVNAAVSYVRGKNNTTDDNLYNMMPLNARFSLQHNYNNWNNAIELELVDDKRYLSAVRNEVATKGYGVINLRSSYQLNALRVDFGIENLFDKFYHHPLGGAYTGQGKTMSSTDVPWGVSVPAMGRSIYTGISYKF